ncbi:zinc knuckle [Ancylostoma caninum]|uniref:Zinc knuckle n=1 Tax=Ancylostoma caninum TaxID=29170 RepID=A0A368FY84_ANCCA|nr:zinc knuckle [Ancylostoma caninum]
MPVLPEELTEDVLLGDQESDGNARERQIPRVGVMPNSDQNDVQDRHRDALELLHITGLDSAADIERFLDRSIQDSEDMQRLRELFECERNKVVESAQQMKCSESGQEQIICSLREQLETYELQMAELTERVESLGQNRNSEGAVDVNTCDPHVLMAIARRRLREEKGRGTYVGHRELPPGMSGHTEPLVEFMKVSALPEVTPFYGKEKENFKRFVNAFSVKYPSSLWDDRSRIQLFEDFLRKALTMFETLPHSIKNGTFEEVVQAMKERLKVDTNGSCVKAMTQLSSLAIREGQSVAEFCLALEKLVGRAYPDTSPEVVSLQKAEILFWQLAKWERSYCIAETIETSPRGEVYEKVEEVALRLERNRDMAIRMTPPTRCERTRHLGKGNTALKDNTARVFHKRAGIRATSGTETTTDSEERGPVSGSTQNQPMSVKRTVVERGSEREYIQCFKCGRRGHKARDCSISPKQEQRGTAASGKNQENQKGSFSALLDRFLCSSTIAEMDDHAKELFGHKLVVNVEMMNMQVGALLDTGSETSIIPIALFKVARDGNIDIDAYVERIPRIEAVVRNASGQRMQYLDTIRMEVGLDGARRRIAFQVGDGLDRLVILGTNALEQFGIHLVKKKEQAPTIQKDELVVDAKHELVSTQAVVAQRMYVPPGASRNVELRGRPGDKMLWSNNKLVSHGCCTISKEGTVTIPVVNTGTEPMVLQQGQVIGEFSDDECAAEEDNAALSPFFSCPGNGRVNSEHEEFHCTIRGTSFGSVVPDADDVISALPVTTTYSLARYLTIYENEADVHTRRYLMSDHAHFALSVTGVEKAYLYFKSKCDHVARALLKHDGSFIVLTYDGGLKVNVEQLNDLANAGIVHAMNHNWDEVEIRAGFRCYERVIKNLSDDTKILLYDVVKEVYGGIRMYPALKSCVFVSSTSDVPVDAKEWNALASTLASYTRRGTKIIALSGPRGDAAWEWNRNKTITTFEVVKEAAAAMRSNVVIMLGRIPQMSEPCFDGRSLKAGATRIVPCTGGETILRAATGCNCATHKGGAV